MIIYDTRSGEVRIRPEAALPLELAAPVAPPRPVTVLAGGTVIERDCAGPFQKGEVIRIAHPLLGWGTLVGVGDGEIIGVARSPF